MKKVDAVFNPPQQHWVGDGFPVRSIFSYHREARLLDPFLLLDFAGPAEFAPTTHRRGVGQHPHRGFETVTIVYDGEVSHHDSTGQGGTIGPGDVQWMTAGAGILHEEYHSERLAQNGGLFRMIQLWVNLPAKDKMTPPKYQALLNQQMPVANLPDDAGKARVIAGTFLGETGPAQTFTPIEVVDLQIKAGHQFKLPLTEGYTTALVVLQGTILVNDQSLAREAQMVLLSRQGQEATIEANNDATVLLIAGAPIDEPVYGHGPFVMNSQEEIIQAFNDFNRGNFGEIPARPSSSS